jgi:hypothetical protein
MFTKKITYQKSVFYGRNNYLRSIYRKLFCAQINLIIYYFFILSQISQKRSFGKYKDFRVVGRNG